MNPGDYCLVAKQLLVDLVIFYRIQVIEINIPPLRERREDIRLLVEHILSRYDKENYRRDAQSDQLASRRDRQVPEDPPSIVAAENAKI